MKIIGLIFLIILILILLFLLFIIFKFKGTIKDIKRVDKEGLLYYCECKKDYHSFIYHTLFKLMRGSGCTAFFTKNSNDELITCRNYDMPHLYKGELTGLNVILKISGVSKYDSINGVDGAWCGFLKFPYYKGALDNKKITKIPTALFPYLTMDGINSEGLSVSILALDLKKGEHAVNQKEKGKKKLTINELTRNLLDNCKDVDEVISYVNNINLVNLFNYDYHLFVTDKLGRSIVIEWRFNKTTITNTDVCSNFYLSYDDACDCYYGSELKEKFTKAENTILDYNYGYGHGYERFKITTLELDKLRKKNEKISDRDAMKLLSTVSQDYDGNLTSYTQYSVIYNNTSLKCTYVPNKDYENVYEFVLE